MFLKHYIFAILWLVCSAKAISQNVAGSEAVGLSNNAVCLKGAFATFNNPAALFDLKKAEIGLQFQKRFNTDINRSNLSVAFPVKGIMAGIGVDYFGNRLYSESVIQAALSNKIADHTGIGVGIQWVHFSSLGYGNRNRLAVQMGFLHELGKKLNVGVHFKNMTMQDGYLENEKRETTAQAGIEYKQSEKVTLYTTIGGSTRYQSFGSIGMQYAATDYFIGRIGFSTGVEPVSLGFGLKLKKLTINAAVRVHNALGASSEVSLVYAKF